VITGYLAAEGFLAEVRAELGDAIEATYGNLVLSPTSSDHVIWAANTWRNPVRLPISSIADGAHKLRALQRNWALYPYAHHRRAALITERLPSVSAKPLAFGAALPTAPLGSWTLIEPDVILASADCSSAVPNGQMQFVEDRLAPPSRAYLKLWELFTLLGERPKANEFCLDLGASPGGWTWVLQGLGATVLSVDKAPLDPRIVALPGVRYVQESAFALDPGTVGPVDWLFSDVVCYPKRLLVLVQKWLEAGTARRFICTIKFQDETDFETLRAFTAIPWSRLMHLHHNKHELTWVKLS
jgi:23S rRNA (cytidine2498-2'-O)-methyltransferase